VHDEDTDDGPPQAEPALELLINQVWFADIDDGPTVSDGPSIAWPVLTGVGSPAPTQSSPVAPAAVPAERARMNASAAA
jgi:hypothetical protein